MKKTRAISGVAIIAVVLGLGLVGCGDKEEKPSAQTSSSAKTTSEKTTTSKKRSSEKVAPRTQEESGPNPTIATYIKENGIVETPIHLGDTGAPAINLPVPEGWEAAGPDTPDRAYSAIIYTGPEAAEYTPSIVAIVSKLTGNVDPQKLLDLAPGELQNLNDYQALGQGEDSTLGGYPAYQLAGTWVMDGQTKVVAQKTVIIEGPDAIFVLQLNADGLEDQGAVIGPATTVIDEETTITF